MGYVIVVIWLVLIVGIFWAVTKKRDQHAAARARKLEALLTEVKLSTVPPTTPRSGIATPAANAGGGALAGSGLSRKQRLLPQAEALLYYVFRAGLPDHEIFANLMLADLVEIAPGMRGNEREQMARRLALQRMNLVVCTRQLEVVAAVMVDPGTVPAAVHAVNVRFAEECLQAAGIRLVRVDPATPLRHQQVRDLVYGGRV